jgi:hypothetical protein
MLARRSVGQPPLAPARPVPSPPRKAPRSLSDKRQHHEVGRTLAQVGRASRSRRDRGFRGRSTCIASETSIQSTRRVTARSSPPGAAAHRPTPWECFCPLSGCLRHASAAWMAGAVDGGHARRSPPAASGAGLACGARAGRYCHGGRARPPPAPAARIGLPCYRGIALHPQDMPRSRASAFDPHGDQRRAGLRNLRQGRTTTLSKSSWSWSSWPS